MSTNYDYTIQEFLREIKFMKETIRPVLSHSMTSTEYNLNDLTRESMDRLRILEEKVSLINTRVQFLETNWQREGHYHHDTEERTAKLLRLLVKAESIVNNLTVENQNLRAQMDSMTSRKRDEPSTVNTAKSPAKPTSVSGSRVTWADERAVPLNTAIPHLSQAQLKGFRRTNSAPAPPFLVQRAPNSIPRDIPTAPSTVITPPVVSGKDYSHLSHFSQKNPVAVVWNNNNPMVPDPSRTAQYKYNKRGPGPGPEQRKVEPVKQEEVDKKEVEPVNPLNVNYPTGYDPHKRRYSVSSESFSPEQFRDVKLRVIPKSDEVKTKIRSTVQFNVLFKHLDEEELGELVDAMEEVEFQPNTEVIKEGDYVDQNNMYLVNKGELKVYYGQEPVATLTTGSAFGEIALMYGCPRTATVKTITPCSLWVLDRNTFRRILMEESMRRRKLYESVLAKVPIFKGLLPYERTKVADALETQSYKDKDIIIEEGSTDTDKFYIIEKGEVVCTKKGVDGNTVEALRLSSGDYFGELALLNNEPRQATVTAVGNVKCLTIGREHFNQVMGPCEDILRRNMDSYKSYADLVVSINNPEPKRQEKVRFDYTFTSLPNNRHESCLFIIKNEEEYIYNLTQTDGYANAMVEHREELNLSEDDLKSIFSDSKEILSVHKNFFKSLQEALDNKKTASEPIENMEFGSLYSHLVSSFTVYDTYVHNYSKALKTIEKCKENQKFKLFLDECVDVAGERIEIYLQCIFIRVPQVVALLQHLIEVTEPSHTDRNVLGIVLKKAEAYRITLRNIIEAL